MLVHGRPLVYRDDAVGRWRTVSQRAVRLDSVVVATPSLNQELGFAQLVENLTVQQLISKPPDGRTNPLRQRGHAPLCGDRVGDDRQGSSPL